MPTPTDRTGRDPESRESWAKDITDDGIVGYSFNIGADVDNTELKDSDREELDDDENLDSSLGDEEQTK